MGKCMHLKKNKEIKSYVGNSIRLNPLKLQILKIYSKLKPLKIIKSLLYENSKH